MKKTIFFLIFVGLVVALGIFVFAQGFPGNEVNQMFMFCDNSWSVNCGFPAPFTGSCFESDGGYNPVVPAQVVGEFFNMRIILNNASDNGPQYVPLAQRQCVTGNEYCVDSVNLAEVVCGSNIGVTATNFNTMFPGVLWSCIGNPAALMYVNCVTYANNNPQLGLTGVCASGACV